MIGIRRVLLVGLFILLASNIFSQPYSNYIDYSSKWSCKAVGGAPIPYIQYFTYNVVGDTTILGIDYFKIYKFGVDSSFVNGQFSGVDPINEYSGALREDNFKKIYFIFPGSSVEVLCFDFNLYVGAVVDPMQCSFACPGEYVMNIDTVLLGTRPLQRFHLSNGVSIIEGVGSEGGLIEYGSNCIFWDVATYLICYENDSGNLIINNSITCDFYNSIGENSLPNIDISPNPVTSKIFLQAPGIIGPIFINIYSIIGNKIYSSSYDAGNSISIDLSFVNSGMYLLKIDSQLGKSVVKKIIKQ